MGYEVLPFSRNFGPEAHNAAEGKDATPRYRCGQRLAEPRLG